MNNTPFKEFSLEECASFIENCAKEQKTLLIIAHRSPDGDAVGTAFALSKLYEAMGAKAFLACSDKVPSYLRPFIKEDEDFICENIPDCDVAITVDTASPTQMGDLQYMCEKVDLSIDHHENCTLYSDYHLVADASAAGEVMFAIYEYLKQKGAVGTLPDVARLLYMAISSDCGSFQFSNTTYNTMLTAGKLLLEINSDEKGMSTSEIARYLYNNKTVDELRAKKVFIDNLAFAADGKIGYVLITQDVINEYGIAKELLGGGVDIPRSVENVECAFCLKEDEEINEDNTRKYRISARSNGDVNVADICKKFGGGGHAKAAGGAIMAENSEIALKTVLTEFENALKGGNYGS